MAKSRSANGLGSFSQEFGLLARLARRVWRLIPRRHKIALGVAALLTAGVAACNVSVSLLLGGLVDRIKVGLEHHDEAAIIYGAATFFLALIAAAYITREALGVARRYLVENACTRIEKATTVRVVNQLMRAEFTQLSKEKIGALQGRISRSVVGFMRFIRMGFLDFFPPILTGCLALVAALTKQPWLALAMAGVIPLSLYLTMSQLRSQKGIRLSLIRSREAMDGTVVELLGGLDYVRAAHTGDYEMKRVAAAAEKRRVLENRHHFQMSLYGAAKAMNEAFFHILVLGLAMYLAVHGRISFGDILTFSMLFMSVMTPLNEVHRCVDEGHECSLMVADLMDMLKQPPDRSFSPIEVREPVVEPHRPIIEIEDLGVEYHTANVIKRGLDGVSTVIRHGETIGLAGPSGGGKTTWLRVLLRLTHPTAGRVRIGGVDLDQVSRAAIGRLVGYVGQQPFIFHGTVAENIAYGNRDATPEAIAEAARRANIDHEIMAMPGGYQAIVTERGSNLSGGQRQRIALARVFLKDPPILVLDEGTSALDTISERHVQRAIDLARQDRTVILVAHRLTTLLDADRILVFKDGRIIEEGTYGELYRQGGFFAELVNSAELGTTENGNGKALITAAQLSQALATSGASHL
jgi:ATP-binding cassette subfamily B protein